MSHNFAIHSEDSQHRHMESGYIWETDPVGSRYFDTPIETHANEVAFWRMWIKAYETIANHVLDYDVDLLLSPSIKATKTGKWWHDDKNIPCDCVECSIGENTINFKNDVRISTDTTEVTIHNKKYILKNATIIKSFTDNLNSTKNGIWSPNYTDVIKDIWVKIDAVENEFKNLKSNMDKFKGGIVTVLKNHWNGKVYDQGIIPTTLTAGNYQIFIESPTAGSFSLRLPWIAETDHNAVSTAFTLPIGHSTDGSYGIVKCTITAGSGGVNPKVRFCEVRVNGKGEQTYKVGNTDWYIKVIKREKVVTIG
nr:MAG TPA: hypothetical protein [Caudoviricetes sp.]